MGAEGRGGPEGWWEWWGAAHRLGCGGQAKTGGEDPMPCVEELVSEDVGDPGSPGSTPPRPELGADASQGGARAGLTWLCAALPTPHTVVTTDSDPAG